jgi:hypothetical protein
MHDLEIVFLSIWVASGIRIGHTSMKAYFFIGDEKRESDF